MVSNDYPSMPNQKLARSFARSYFETFIVVLCASLAAVLSSGSSRTCCPAHALRLNGNNLVSRQMCCASRLAVARNSDSVLAHCVYAVCAGHVSNLPVSWMEWLG